MKYSILFAFTTFAVVSVSNAGFLKDVLVKVEDGAKLGVDKTKEAFDRTREVVRGFIFPSSKEEATTTVKSQVTDGDKANGTITGDVPATEDKVTEAATVTTTSSTTTAKTVEVKSDDKDKISVGSDAASNNGTVITEEGKREVVADETTTEVTEGKPDGREFIGAGCTGGTSRSSTGTCEKAY